MGAPYPEIDVSAARRAIAGIAIETPVLSVPELALPLGAAQVSLKLENLQVTGSFKVRGAANRMLALAPEERERGVVACSSGNHGRAVAYVAAQLGIPATVCLPKWVDRGKLEAIRRLGAEPLLDGETYDDAERRAREIEQELDLTPIHPFDDPWVIAGQATVGCELAEQCPRTDAVLVPLSGGGLISGVALALKSVDSAVRIIGVSAANACVMYESLKAGQPIAVPEEETIANALSGGIGLENRYTFRLVQELVDEHVLVSEPKIREAMAFAAVELGLMVEGGGAVALAALRCRRVAVAGERVAAVVSGGNVEPQALYELISERDR